MTGRSNLHIYTHTHTDICINMHTFSCDAIFHPTATSASKRNATCLVVWSGNLASTVKITCKQSSRQDVPVDNNEAWLDSSPRRRSGKFRGAAPVQMTRRRQLGLFYSQTLVSTHGVYLNNNTCWRIGVPTNTNRHVLLKSYHHTFFMSDERKSLRHVMLLMALRITNFMIMICNLRYCMELLIHIFDIPATRGIYNTVGELFSARTNRVNSTSTLYIIYCGKIVDF